MSALKQPSTAVPRAYSGFDQMPLGNSWRQGRSKSVNQDHNPFGGEKNSGIGRFNGRWAVDAFTSDQWVTIQHTPRPYPTNAN